MSTPVHPIEVVLSLEQRIKGLEAERAERDARITVLEDAIKDTGIILANAHYGEGPVIAMRDAMQSLARVMKDPTILKRRGI